VIRGVSEYSRWLAGAVPVSLGRVGLCILLMVVGGRPLCGQALNVLLTNDDGFEAPGIVAMHGALLEAGHRVTLVAPLKNQSGVGSAITTSGTIDYYPQETGVWAVDGTPADAVALALTHLMRTDPPDLVISGANFGQNVGASVVSSGTVGAALTGARAGIPAIAVSIAIDPRQAEGLSGTLDAMLPAAELTVDIVRQLAESADGELLPPRTVLNLNYPAVGDRAPGGTRFATVSAHRGFRQVFTVAGDSGPARVGMALANTDRAEEGSDLSLLSNGFVTLSVLEGNLGMGKESWPPFLQRLAVER